MSTAVAPLPIALAPAITPPPGSALPFAGASLRKFTVDEYHEMIRTGILKEGDPVELLQGYLVLKMARNPEHDGPMDLFEGAIGDMIPTGWFLRIQRAITLGEQDVVAGVAVERGIKVDEIDGLVCDVTAQHVEIVAVIQLVHGLQGF